MDVNKTLIAIVKKANRICDYIRSICTVHTEGFVKSACSNTYDMDEIRCSSGYLDIKFERYSNDTDELWTICDNVCYKYITLPERWLSADNYEDLISQEYADWKERYKDVLEAERKKKEAAENKKREKEYKKYLELKKKFEEQR